MKKYKNTLFYVAVIGFFAVLIYFISQHGVTLETGRNVQHAQSGNSQWTDFINSMIFNLKHPLAILLAQIVTIILAARLFGWMSNKIGQPAVIGEMIAGIVLGPSLLGMYFPEISSTLFPKESLGNIQFLSQIGLIFFMYTIGMELDLKILKNKAHEAVVISHASIIFPFALGMGLAYFIYQEFAPANAPFLSFALFTGISMSVTAFPVLARIVQERGIHKTKLGTIAITCAAADDITAWCILAVVIAIVKAGDFGSALYVILLAVGYVLFMIKIVRPFLHRISTIYPTKSTITRPIIAIFFLVLILSSYATEVIGIHALFGAFMAGAIMPDNMKFRNIFIEKVEDVAVVVLLPLFFVYTGLRTEIGLLNDPHLWKITGLIILVAVTGKFVGSALAAKFVGQNWRESLVIGALMNTRGLMELIVLNIGYDLGVLDAEIFAMLVIMALITTFMTGPLIDFIDKIFKHKSDEQILEISAQPKYKILLNFNSPDKGKALLRIANAFIKKDNENSLITGMHILKSSDIEHHALEERESKFFAPLIEEAENLQQNVTTMFKVSTDTIQETIDVAQKGDYDLMLTSVRNSIYSGSFLGNILGFTTKIIDPDILIEQVKGRENMFDHSAFDERTKQLLNKTNIPVGIVLEKGIEKVEKVFLPLFGNNDADLLKYAQRLISNNEAQIIIVDVSGYTKKHSEVKEIIRSIENIAPNHISLLYKQSLDKEFLEEMDLMIVSIESWRNLIETKSIWISNVPTTLIIAE
ncbi:transporter, CPA2 family [Chishuiella changwenlii]|uniref:Cation/H(+) antiporter n=1 Tax=Chishuiella changwenlii TaxID=1434701 RepID=A0A1M6U533_9FLAO|nr:cation:proton antiporter [Chishuiella changwenlii]GGE99931.1 cation/H(+) antiporter [Chishuiella changwenlii]SHK64297.1 transporter, CPA2 family [Chishuiella changwenlii]